MDLSSSTLFWTAYASCNIVALVGLVACLDKPLFARLLYSLVFGVACMVQAYIAFFEPGSYQALAEYALLPIYKTFILGWLPQHTPEFILGVATLQLWIGLSLWAKGWVFKAGVIAGTLMVVLMMPLGLAAAFPAPLNLIVGLQLLKRRQATNYLLPQLTKRYIKTKEYAIR